MKTNEVKVRLQIPQKDIDSFVKYNAEVIKVKVSPEVDFLEQMTLLSSILNFYRLSPIENTVDSKEFRLMFDEDLTVGVMLARIIGGIEGLSIVE